MASFRKRGDYQWQARVKRKGFGVLTETFNTKAEAMEWARETESKIDRRIYVDRREANKLTLLEACKRYEKEFTSKKKGAVCERSKLRILQRAPLALRSLASIQPGDIVDYRDARLRTPETALDPKRVGPSTVTKELNLLSSIFRKAASEWKLPVLNPVTGISRPSKPRGRERRLKDDAEMQWIINASQSAELKVIVPLAVHSAMRRSEMVNAMRSDVDIEGQKLRLRDTKNGDRRDVPLSKASIELIKAIPKRKDGRLFGLRPNSVTQAFIRAVERARRLYEEDCQKNGVEPVPGYLQNLRLHDMRHEATTRITSKLANPLEAMAVTGHRDYRSIKGYYHPDATELAKKLDS